MADGTASGYLEGRIEALREHVAALAAAAPALPGELARVGEQMSQELAARGVGTLLLIVLGFAGLGFLVEGAFRYWTRGAHSEVRWKAIGLRFARDAGALAAFTIGAAGAFLAFDWPPRTRGAVLALLTAFVCVRAAIVVARALLSPRDERLRVVPIDSLTAYFWERRLVLFAAWLAVGWMIVERLQANNMDPAARQIVAYTLGLGLLAIAIEALWRRSRAAALATLVLWALWVVGAMGIFWLAALALALPFVLSQVQASVDHVLTRGMLAAAIGRGVRALLILGAAVIVVRALHLDVDALASSQAFWPSLVRGAVQALAIVLVADLAWHVAASLIDQKLAGGAANTRLQTLLPIVRTTLAVVLLVMAVLMAISALGVQVGPLLASAGVVGIAVGFGAQQLVRDLFAKFSYLMDDAFRLGEYIESGNFKGTVEYLGGRSIRLRHHRGAVFTIPYGQLGAVKNSSRDWVIDKLTIGVAYDTDLDKAKKLIKKIGQELAQDAEFASKILEPLKMQGVEQFGDYAIELRIKMMTKPNEQFTIRRRAYAMIKKAFAENGIKFAHPTVQVANPGDAAVAAAALRNIERDKAQV